MRNRIPGKKLKPMAFACSFACWHIGMEWRVQNGLAYAS